MNQNNSFSSKSELQSGSEVYIDEFVPMFRFPDFEAPYEILISLKYDDFNTRFSSVSDFYKILSQSNQSIGVSNPTKNFTNRKWWNYHFSGGHFFTYKCGEDLHIHIVLNRNENCLLPSEIQVKMRIIKAFRGFKPNIVVGINNTLLYRTAYGYRKCSTTIQYLGDSIPEKDELPF